MAKTTFKIEGLKELDAALGELPRATGKNVLRRVLRKTGETMAGDMEAMAPRLTGALQVSIGVGTKLSRRQAALHRKMFKSDRASVEMFVGAGSNPQAITQEFGTFNQPPQPFARPAWDGNKEWMLRTIKGDLADEIMKSARRLARKRARAAAKG